MPQTKKNTQIFQEKQINLSEELQLPSSYNQTYLTLIARDPYWIFAYWEVTEASLSRLKEFVGQDLSNGCFVIRMYDVTYIDFDGTNANRTFDIEIDLRANNWYINLWNDNATFCADLGFRTSDGRFFALARSNFVTTPRFWPSGRKDEIWMEVKDNRLKPFVIVREETSQPKKQQQKEPPHISEKRLKRMQIREEDIRAYYSKLSPKLHELIAQRLSRYKSYLKYRKPKQVLPYSKGPISTLLPSDYTRKLFLGSSAQEFFGASESIFSGASQQVFEAKKRLREFFFEIGTELIVYGRTEPNATVYFNNKQIQLNKDGTFRMQFLLSDASKIPLEFLAISADREEKREISTEVERKKTKYNP